MTIYAVSSLRPSRPGELRNHSHDAAAQIRQFLLTLVLPLEGSFNMTYYLNDVYKLCLSIDLQPLVGAWPLFFTHSVGLIGWRISPSQGRYTK
jgi:hypothetical protein